MDEKWGDWRPHLAMVLANNSSKPDLDRKSLSTLGDTLGKKLKENSSRDRVNETSCQSGKNEITISFEELWSHVLK